MDFAFRTLHIALGTADFAFRISHFAFHTSIFVRADGDGGEASGAGRRSDAEEGEARGVAEEDNAAGGDEDEAVVSFAIEAQEPEEEPRLCAVGEDLFGLIPVVDSVESDDEACPGETEEEEVEKEEKAPAAGEAEDGIFVLEMDDVGPAEWGFEAVPERDSAAFNTDVVAQAVVVRVEVVGVVRHAATPAVRDEGKDGHPSAE